MNESSARLTAALLSQNPGSQVLESNPGVTLISLALHPVKKVVALLEVDEGGPQLAERVRQLTATAKTGVPLHVVLINPRQLDVSAVIQAHVKPTLFQMKAMGGWNWVPGQLPVSVRGLRLPQLGQAAKLANSNTSLSLDAVQEQSQRHGDELQVFQQAVMQRRPWVSWGIAVVCVALFGLQMLWGDGLPVLAASRMGAEIPSRVLAGEWWRLFSVMLLHANVPHLALNMIAMLSFGTFLERLIGNGRYLVLYVLSGLGGSLLSLTRGGDGIGVGASGGVWGLMVAGAVVVTWPRGLLPVALAHQLRQRAWVPVGINLVYSLQPGIDMLAHLGGGISGALLVMVLTQGAAPQQPLKNSRLFTALAAAVLLLMAGSLGIALANGRPWELRLKWALTTQPLEGTKLGVLMPSFLTLNHEAGANRWHWGELNSTGAELIILVTQPLGDEFEITDGSLDEMVQELKKPPQGTHYTQPPARKTLPSGREVVFFAAAPDDKNDVRFMWQWYSLEGRQWVVVFANALNTTSAERKLQLEEIADSLGPRSPP